MQARPLPKHYYTVAEWEKLPEYPRYELIDGELFMMARPSIEHQEINAELTTQFRIYLRGKRCRVIPEPNLRLYVNGDTVVHPDLIIVCDPSKLQKNYCVGAPELVVEILSPSTAIHDKFVKLNRYQQVGVREYWIVDPLNRLVEVYQWDNGLCHPHPYGPEDKIKVSVLDDCEIDLSLVFPEPEETEIDPENKREME